MNIVMGSRGRLGRALVASFAPGKVVTPDRAVYADWWKEGAADEVAAYLADQAGAVDALYLAAGVIDPRCAAEDHDRVNYRLARNVIEGATRVGIRVVTFGTIMEVLLGERSSNPYIASKTRLGNFVQNLANTCGTALHIRVHTLYGGGPPDTFMFLGQMYRAIAEQRPFAMTSGEQLREYHHIEDEVTAISLLVASDARGVVNLNHGAPVTLKSLATYVFECFGCQELLQIGGLCSPEAENYGVSFERASELTSIRFRETLPSVAEYLRAHLSLEGDLT